MEFSTLLGAKLSETGDNAITYHYYKKRSSTVIEFYVRGEAHLRDNQDVFQTFAEEFTKKALEIKKVDFSRRKYVESKIGNSTYQFLTLYSDTPGKSSLLMEIEILGHMRKPVDEYINSIYSDVCKDNEVYEDDMVDNAIKKYNATHTEQIPLTKTEPLMPNTVTAKNKNFTIEDIFKDNKPAIDLMQLSEAQLKLAEQMEEAGELKDWNDLDTAGLIARIEAKKNEPVDLEKLTEEETKKCDELLESGKIEDLSSMTMLQLKDLLKQEMAI